MVSVRTEKRYFLKHELEVSGHWIEVPVDRIVDKQDGEEIEPFDRTIRVGGGQGRVRADRAARRVKFKEVYQPAAGHR